jgi:hypothetical protein
MIELNRVEKLATTIIIVTSLVILSSTMLQSIPLSTPSRSNLSIAASLGGTTDPSLGIYSYLKGFAANVSAIPDQGYHFDHWNLDGLETKENPISILINASHSLRAVFAVNSPLPVGDHYLIISTTLGGRTDPPAEIHRYSEGSRAIVTAISYISHRFDHWKYNGQLITENPLAVPVENDIYLLAVFAAVSFAPPAGSNVIGEVEGTELKLESEITIDGIGIFMFDPHSITSKRSDIFQLGHFSIFDVVVYLSETGKISAEHHFDEEMNTHVIDSIDGKRNWWYRAYYDGGGAESNVFRMDHYPVKDKMSIQLFRTNEDMLKSIYSSFRNQIMRARQNKNPTIAEAKIEGNVETLLFQNVTVEAHNIRNDVFKPGIITAIDVILSLADQGKISYDLRWYAAIGSSEVKSYWVERINEDIASGSCGFVYESGERSLSGSNHIHLPSDMRVINSPEYTLWFWICLG